MEAIIHQIAAKFIEQVLTVLREKGIASIGQVGHELVSIAKNTALEVIATTVSQIDQALLDASHERRADGLRVKERNVPRAFLTELGVLRYERTYFETKAGDRCYLVDHLIGVEPYERLSKELCASLVQAAAEQSMEKAAKRLGVNVSRQTVDTKVLALKEVAVDAVRQGETPKELHVFADEDHVHLKSGHGAIVPLVTVTEGIDTAGKRHKTRKPVHFAGYGIRNESFFENVSSFLHERYCMERVEKVYVHADGGQWISAAKDWFPNVQFVMDGFHLAKRLKQLGRLEGGAAYRGAIHKAIRENDRGRFAACCERLRVKQDEHGRKVLADNEGFIQNHWDAVALRMSDQVCGSCTEPLVSHVLSERLSRNPLAWSADGLRQMAMLRVFVMNGGHVTAKDIRIARKKEELDNDKVAFQQGFAKYKAYADKQVGDFLTTKLDWSIFEEPRFQYGKLDGTSLLLRAWGAARDCLASA